MHRFPVRALTAVAVALTAGFAVTGCTPPNEQVSDQKVDNATEAPAGQATGTTTSTQTSTETTASTSSKPAEDPADGEPGEQGVAPAEEFDAEDAGEAACAGDGIDCELPAEDAGEAF